MLGPVAYGGPAYQAVKKILEGVKFADTERERALGDLLGAINYIAMLILIIDERPEELGWLQILKVCGLKPSLEEDE